MTQHVRVAVIGAGFSGIAMAAGLRRAGVEDFVVLERAADVGGVWRDNTYPGAACDIPSQLYSLSFAPNPEWRRSFSRGDEIWDYLRRVAGEQGIRPHIRFRREVRDAAWDDGGQRWRIVTGEETLTAQILIDCAGALTEPAIPDLPGLASFTGTVFHSARWDHGHDLTGDRVAVVGSGASAIQFVPEIQPRVGELRIFQRTPGWVIPRIDRPTSALQRRLLGAVPALARLLRAGQFLYFDVLLYPIIRRSRAARVLSQGISQAMLRRQVKDPALRAKLTPSFEIGCKRILVSNDWYRAVTQPNVEVVPHGLSEVRERSVVAADGSEYRVDTIIFATGFHVADAPIAERIRGRDGRSLGAVWGGAPRTYRATQVAGFPNYFRLCGAGTGLGHGSQVWLMEAQVDYVLDVLRAMTERGLSSVVVREEAQDAYLREIDSELDATVWMAGSCTSWYLDSGGRASVMWPRSMRAFRRMLREGFQPADHHLTAAADQVDPIPS